MSRNIERDRGIARVEGTTVSFTASSNTCSDSGNGFGSLVVGVPVLVSGAANNANNGLVLPTTVAAGNFTITRTKFVDESAAANIEVRIG